MTVKTTTDPKARPPLRRHPATVAAEAMQLLSLRPKPPSRPILLLSAMPSHPRQPRRVAVAARGLSNRSTDPKRRSFGSVCRPKRSPNAERGAVHESERY
jgi:hypothetical protein